MKRNKADANFSNVNPIGKTFEDAPSFNRVWLKTSVPLNGIQRIGFSLLSIVILLGSVMFFQRWTATGEGWVFLGYIYDCV